MVNILGADGGSPWFQTLQCVYRSGQDWFLMGKGFGVWSCGREQTGEGRSHCFQQIAETSIGVKVDSRFAMTTMVGWYGVLGA